MVKVTRNQKADYDKHSRHPQFIMNNHVWLSNSRCGKLDLQWEGRWTVTDVKGETTVEVCKRNTRKVAHVNHLQHCKGFQDTAIPIELQES